MKQGTTIATGLAAGYLLGRTRKMRLALTLAAVSATGKLGVRPSETVEKRLNQLGGSEVGKIAGTVRNELFSAAKTAATTAATGRIDALTDRVNAGLADAAGAGKAVGGAKEKAKGRKADEQEADTGARDEERDESAELDASGERDEEEPRDESAEGEGENEGEGAKADEDEDARRPAVRRASHSRGSSASGSRRSSPRRREQGEPAPSTRRRQTAATSGRK
jgi:hypothetical protein